MHNQRLHCVNCHQCTEASDFLGGLRPVRHSSTNNEATNSTDDSRLFEWVNGPLVVAMLNGDLFLLDEISLADDAVLERLNSLLEPERQLHLAECTEDLLDGTSLDTTQLTADPKFRFIATMNPGGDYGKKELSPALRNRFTEIWCPSPTFTAVHPSSLSSSVRPDESLLKELSNPLTDWIDIVQHNLKLKLPNIFSGENNRLARQFSEKMVNFIQWLAVTQEECKSNGITSLHHRSPPTIRDLIAWIEFIRTVVRTNDDNQGNCNNVNNNPTGFFCTTIRYLIDQMSSIDKNLIDTIQQPFPDFETIYANFCTPMNEEFVLKKSTECFGCDPFFIPTGPYLPYGDDVTTPTSFIFDAPTPASNLKRLLRAMQLPGRALLLEGSPGVGKTTLVMALAKASGHKVIRINLSEATEASDLFGCDLPVEGAEAGVFAWKSGPFLQGLCDGHWIVLDEVSVDTHYCY
ncbi:unnamed protein product [Trichobilharzia regenti]|nr:unnamed protein product [Trichobilharzia regenti]